MKMEEEGPLQKKGDSVQHVCSNEVNLCLTHKFIGNHFSGEIIELLINTG